MGSIGPRELRRDHGLALIGRINRWMLAGSLMLAGFLAYVADHAFRGHALSSSGTPVSASSSTPAPASAAGDGLQQPAQPPSAPLSSAPAPVVSGGS